MKTRVGQFEAVRLGRDAASAGTAFGFEDVDTGSFDRPHASAWRMGAGFVVMLACCLLYGLA